MFIVRWILGQIILFLNFVFSPRSPKRTEEEQQNINVKTSNLSLYQLPACPFCVKVRRAMKREGIVIPLRNTKENSPYREELINGGGKHKVPCLRIVQPDGEIEWLYESSDIVDYLKKFTA